jgi:ligand-binding sensor domain-containing protein/signal transduction histidine kinase
MPKYCWTLFRVWLWLCAGCFQLAAQTNLHYTVDIFDSDAGLPQNSVISMTQTRDGYLWVGTLNGLARFDGLRFTTFDESNTPELNASPIIRLFEDAAGYLWIGTDGGDILRVKDGKVARVELGTATHETRLMSICEDRAGSVWLYTANGLLGQYHNGHLETWSIARGLPSKSRAMISDSSGKLWVGTDLFLYGLQPGAVASNKDVPAEAYEKRPVFGLDFLLPSQTGGFWCLARGRIRKWSGGHLEPGFDWPYPWNTSSTPVNAVCEDQHGHLVIGTGGEGVFWFDSQGKHIQLNSATSRLSHNTILSLCVDKEGDLWVGTDGGGLNRMKPQVFNVLESSLGATVQSVCEDSQGGLWIGYHDDRIEHWSDGKPEEFGSLHGLGGFGVKSVFVDRDQHVWAGTYLGGLLQLEDARFVRPTAADEAIGHQQVSAVFQDRSGRLWAGTQSGLVSSDGHAWNRVSDESLACPIRAITEDQQGNLWIGTQGRGLVRKHEPQTTSFGKKDGLPTDNIYCLYAEAPDRLWVGTSGGLACFQNGRWSSYAGRLGEVSRSIAYLLDDRHGHLWIGSNAGLVRVLKQDLAQLASSKDPVPVRSFGKPDGLPTGECSQGSQPAACFDRDGRLWFPTIKGLVSVDPGQLKRNTNAPPVLFEEVFVDGRLEGSNALRATAPLAVTLPADKETLEIHFTSLNLSAPDKGLFKYRLEGHETSWNDSPGSIRYARYSKLPHGNYRFQVLACNEDGVWNNTGASLAVTVLPPFWQTGWFIATTAACLVLMIAGSVYYVATQRLQRELAGLRQQEALEHERARIARDLHDQLGANLTQVALLGEMAETDKDLPEEVEEHARQISQTARETTRALDEIVWTVNPSNDTLDGLINYVCKYAQEYLALAGLRYRLEVPPQLPNTPISPELRHNVFLAAKEAVNNVVKHAHASSAWLRLTLDSSQFVLEIEDDGSGMSAADADKGRNGLRNMRKRMEDIGGAFTISPRAEGGTRVQLTAPLANGHSAADVQQG